MRDEFSESVKRIVSARVGNRCSKPDCRAATSGPKVDPTGAINVGVAAHITAASLGGPRHNPNLSQEERTDYSNAIWLCQTCANLIDKDVDRFPVNLLQDWKMHAEEAAFKEVGKNSSWSSSQFPKGSPTLQIDPPQPLARFPLSRLLRPHNCFVPLIGRERELKSITSFCEAQAHFQWLVLTGEGGVGKTRLAIEVVQSCSDKGWIAGFLAAEAISRWVQHDGFVRWSPETDTLIVVEYAAAKVEGLKSVLWRCGSWVEGSPTRGKVRLLLLERRADPKEGWLFDLVNSAEGGLRERIQSAMEPVLSLGPAGGAGREEAARAILERTFEKWATLPGGGPTPPCPELSSSQIEELLNNTGGRPLFVEMAALRACAANDTSRITRWGQGELLADLVEREGLYARRYCGSDAVLADLVERAMVIVSLTGPVNRSSPVWVKTLAADAERCGYPGTRSGEVSKAVAILLGENRWQDRTVIMPMSPDLVAEAFMVEVLGKRSDCVVETIEGLLDSAGAALWNAWNTLLRSAVDLHAWHEFAAVRAWIATLVRRRPVAEQRVVESMIHTQSIALSGIACILVERHLAELPPLPDSRLERARLLDRLALLYSTQHKPEKALAASSQSVEIFKNLAIEVPHAKLELAASLSTLSLTHAGLGKRRESLKLAEEAVLLCEGLMEEKIGDLLPLLAKILVGLGASYGELGQHEKSLGATRRAVEIYEDLARQLPNVYEVPLAASLDNLGLGYSMLGKSQQALAAASRAADIFRRYAERNADIFEPELATSLNNLSNCYTHLGREEEALSAAVRAVTISENLQKLVPGLFAPLHALSLQNMAVSYGVVGNLEQALNAGRRAADIYENMARENPALYEPMLEKALSHLNLIYGKLKRPEGVLAIAKRAGNLYEELARGDWESYWQKLAQSLDGMAVCYRAFGQKEDELRTTERLAEVYQRGRGGASVEKQLAATFSTLGHLKLEQNPREAMVCFRQGIETLRNLFMAEPIRFGTLMDSLMKDYFDSCDSLGDEPDWALINPIANVRRRFI